VPGNRVFGKAWGVLAEAAGRGESVPHSNPALAVQGVSAHAIGAAGLCDAVSLVSGRGHSWGIAVLHFPSLAGRSFNPLYKYWEV
jgi:hypothetical protein